MRVGARSARGKKARLSTMKRVYAWSRFELGCGYADRVKDSMARVGSWQRAVPSGLALYAETVKADELDADESSWLILADEGV